MKNFLLITSLLLLNLLLFAGPVFSSDMQLEDGEWEMTTKMTIEGAPAGMPEIPAITFRQCLTSDMMIPSQQGNNQDCEMLKQDVSGGTVTWSMRCTTNGVTSEMNGTSTYTGNTMNGTMYMTSQGMKMTNHVTGKRLGSCK